MYNVSFIGILRKSFQDRAFKIWCLDFQTMAGHFLPLDKKCQGIVGIRQVSCLCFQTDAQRVIHILCEIWHLFIIPLL